jgi:hypothetical protein
VTQKSLIPPRAVLGSCSVRLREVISRDLIKVIICIFLEALKVTVG